MSEPQRAFSAKIQPIETAINPQRRGEPSWSSRQVAQPLNLAISLHDRYAVARLERPDEDPSPNPCYLARDVQHVGAAVGKIDIGVPALEKKRPVTRRHPAIGVPGGVADDIRLGLDDAAAGDAFGYLPHQ